MKWQSGVYYRIQLRFGLSDLWTDTNIDFFDWKTQQIKQRKFSEWSTAMVLKPITKPEIVILNNSVFSNDLITTLRNTETSTTPTFFGRYECGTYESVNKYKFNLYSYKNGNKILLETSDWIQYNSNDNKMIIGEEERYSCVLSYRFRTSLESDFNTEVDEFAVSMQVITENLYELESEDYIFTVSPMVLSDNKNLLSISCVDNKPRNVQEGVIDIYFNSDIPGPVSGNYVLVRTDETSNFKVWDDLTYFTFANEYIQNKLSYSDYAIESGLKYKYGIQRQNQAGLRTSPKKEHGDKERIVNFEYSYLYNNGIQLKLKFNNNISSYKKTTIITKQDTLGSKFPIVTRNGNTYYQEFSFGGLISLEMDNDDFSHNFFQKKNNGYYYKNELVIPEEKYNQKYSEKVLVSRFPPTYETQPVDYNTYNQNLTQDNYYIERIFREKVEEFLNESKPKLYKSPTEGNMIIALTNVTMTPEQGLGRLLYSFNATAYEIMDCNLQNLIEYGIIPYQDFKVNIEEGKILFGQINGYYQGDYSRSIKGNEVSLYPIKTSPNNLVEVISDQVESQIGQQEEFQRLLTKVKSIWIEDYPKISLKNDILLCESLIAEQNNKGETADKDIINELKEKLNNLTILQDEINRSGFTPFYSLIIDGQEIQIAPGKIYHLDNINLSNLSDIHLKYSGAIIFNYICEASTIEDKNTVIRSVAEIRTWNQLAGMFTENKSILINYSNEPDYNNISLLSDFNIESIDEIPNHEIHSFKENNIGLYNTYDITQVIKEKSIREIERQQNLKFTHYNKKEDEWDNGEYYYRFEKIVSVEIEGEAGTPIHIIDIEDAKNPYDTRKEHIHYIGSTGKLKYGNLNNSNVIDKIYIEDPQYLIINFIAEVNLTVKGVPETEGDKINVYSKFLV